MKCVELVDVDSLKRPVKVNVEDALNVYLKLLREKAVRGVLIVDEKSGVVLSGHELLEALDMLCVTKVPVLRVDESDVEFKSSNGITIKDVIRAGVSGRRLPPRSFYVNLKTKYEKRYFPLEELELSPKINGKPSRVFENTLELLYENWPTPLVKLKSFSSERRAVFAKLESYNPFSNSVKDRIAWLMITEALKQKFLGEVFYEATSTNTGIAIASIANIHGKRAKLFIPKTIQKVSDTFLKVLGAEVIRLPVSLTVEAIQEVDSLARRDNAIHLNQFENDLNLRVHLKYTARELDGQLNSIGVIPDWIIGGLGTSGHMSAISLYFKGKYGAHVKIIGVQPAQGEVIPGIRRIETGMKWIHMAEFDEIIDITQREAIEGAITIARREGILIGLSSGAVFAAFQKLAENRGTYVLIFPDSGYKYGEQFEEYFRSGSA